MEEESTRPSGESPDTRPARNSTKYVGYVRARILPPDEEATRASLKQQRDAILQYARGPGFEVVRIYEDVQTPQAPDRPAFEAMVKDVRDDPDLAGVICETVDRLVRSQRDYLILLDECRAAGVEFLFVKGYSQLSAAERLGLNMKTMLAKYQTDELRYDREEALREERREFAAQEGRGEDNPHGAPKQGR